MKDSLTLLLIVAISAIGQTPAAIANDSNVRPRVEPIQAHSNGRTYGRSAAEWWKWTLGVPASVNPGLMDEAVDFILADV
jgi:hypothetical protein